MRALLGGEIKFTDGRISSSTGFAEDHRFYQHTASIQPGNSGGPLFDKSGRVIGINTMIVNKEYEDYIDTDVENVFVSLKSKYLSRLMRQNNVNTNRARNTMPDLISEQYQIVKDYIYIVEIK